MKDLVKWLDRTTRTERTDTRVPTHPLLSQYPCVSWKNQRSSHGLFPSDEYGCRVVEDGDVCGKRVSITSDVFIHQITTLKTSVK